jgi:hypothetical protein
VVNTSKLQFATQHKWERKVYRWHTGYPGGLKEVAAERMFLKNPNEILRRAVNGMLPKNPTRRAMMARLRMFPTSEHPHVGQTNNDKNKIQAFRSGLVVNEARPIDKYPAPQEETIGTFYTFPLFTISIFNSPFSLIFF